MPVTPAPKAEAPPPAGTPTPETPVGLAGARFTEIDKDAIGLAVHTPAHVRNAEAAAFRREVTEEFQKAGGKLPLVFVPFGVNLEVILRKHGWIPIDEATERGMKPLDEA